MRALLASDQRAIAGFAEDLEQRVLVHLDGLLDAVDGGLAVRDRCPTRRPRRRRRRRDPCRADRARRRVRAGGLRRPARRDRRRWSSRSRCRFDSSWVRSPVDEALRPSALLRRRRGAVECAEAQPAPARSTCASKRSTGAWSCGSRTMARARCTSGPAAGWPGSQIGCRSREEVSSAADGRHGERRSWPGCRFRCRTDISAILPACADGGGGPGRSTPSRCPPRVVVLVAVRDRWSLDVLAARLVLAWFIVVAAGPWSPFAGRSAAVRRVSFGAGLVALVFVVPAHWRCST